MLFKNLSIDCKTELLTGSVSFNNTVLNGQLTLHAISINRLTMHYQLDVKVANDINRNNGFTNFVNRTIELCDFFKNPMSDPLEWLVYREILSSKVYHIFKSCPVVPV